MLNVKKLGVILRPTKFDFESVAVLNPGCYQEGRFVHLFYRAINKEHESSIGYARLKGPTTVVERLEMPIIRREYDYEKKGVEDPRIVKINDTIYMFYVAHDGKNAVTAYATTKDLKTFEKKGVITPLITYREAEKIFRKSRLKDAYEFFAAFYEKLSGEDVLLWDKDLFSFPKKFIGKFVLVNRILPDIQLVFFDNFKELTTKKFWGNYLENLSKYVILENKHWFETRNIGGGCVPIETKDGWILIFHAVEAKNEGRVYHACAALLDKNNPLKVIGRLHEPLFSPTEEWERSGFVPNVVFPTGTALFDDTLYIYYGAADKRIAVASVKINELLEEMQDPTKGHICVKENKA